MVQEVKFVEKRDRSKNPDSMSQESLGGLGGVKLSNIGDNFRTFTVNNPLHQSNLGLYDAEQFDLVLAILHHTLKASPETMAADMVMHGQHFFTSTMANFFERGSSDADLERFGPFLTADGRKLPMKVRMRSSTKDFMNSWLSGVVKKPFGASPGTIAKSCRDLIFFGGKASKPDLDKVVVSLNKMIQNLSGSKY